MIFVNHMKSAKAAKDYYSQHIAPGDGKYYAKDAAELKGIWHGHAAGMLGLSGEVMQKDFFTLCDNINPETGKQLTPRMDDDRRVLTDFTFDAPKSVSLAYELGGDERILTAFRQSVRETMAEIEQTVETRVRKNGADENRTTGNMIWAEHVHRTTRPVDGLPDPQLHAHATILNATSITPRTDGKPSSSAISSATKVITKPHFMPAWPSKLNDLGYGIEKDRNSFALAGISTRDRREFSRRSAVIDAAAEKLGIEDAAGKSKLGSKTREKKSPEPESLETLKEKWLAKLDSRAASGNQNSPARMGQRRRTHHAGSSQRICAGAFLPESFSSLRKAPQSGSPYLWRRLCQAGRCCGYSTASGSDRRKHGAGNS